MPTLEAEPVDAPSDQPYVSPEDQLDQARADYTRRVEELRAVQDSGETDGLYTASMEHNEAERNLGDIARRASLIGLGSGADAEIAGVKLLAKDKPDYKGDLQVVGGEATTNSVSDSSIDRDVEVLYGPDGNTTLVPESDIAPGSYQPDSSKPFHSSYGQPNLELPGDHTPGYPEDLILPDKE